MLKWLETVKVEMEKVSADEIIGTDDEVKKDDTVVGVVSEDLQKLFTLAKQYQKIAAEKQVAMKFAEDDKEKEEHEAQYWSANNKAGLFRDIFWVELRDQFQLWTKDSVAFRKGWKVVWKDNPLGSLLGRLERFIQEHE